MPTLHHIKRVTADRFTGASFVQLGVWSMLATLGAGVMIALWPSSASRAVGPPTGDPNAKRLCIRTAAGAVVDEQLAAAVVTTAFQQVRQHRDYRAEPAEAPPPVIDVNCAVDPILLRPDVMTARGSESSSRNVPQASRRRETGDYELIFYVLPNTHIDELFWSRTGSVPGQYRMQAESEACEKHEGSPFNDAICSTKTYGMYVTPEEIVDLRAMVEGLKSIYRLV